MTEYTRPATWEDVKAVASLLNEAGVAYALAGGYALAAHGHVRFSEDIFSRQGPYAVRINDVFTIDLLPAACGHGWDELRRFIEEREVDGLRIPVLGLEGHGPFHRRCVAATGGPGASGAGAEGGVAAGGGWARAGGRLAAARRDAQSPGLRHLPTKDLFVLNS